MKAIPGHIKTLRQLISALNRRKLDFGAGPIAPGLA